MYTEECGCVQTREDNPTKFRDRVYVLVTESQSTSNQSLVFRVVLARESGGDPELGLGEFLALKRPMHRQLITQPKVYSKCAKQPNACAFRYKAKNSRELSGSES